MCTKALIESTERDQTMGRERTCRRCGARLERAYAHYPDAQSVCVSPRCQRIEARNHHMAIVALVAAFWIGFVALMVATTAPDPVWGCAWGNTAACKILEERNQ